MFRLSSLYPVFCLIGVVLMAVGALCKDKLPPRIAAAMILVGTVIAMCFLNMSLFSVMGAGIG